MHNPESFIENETQTDHLIRARRPDQMITKKKKKKKKKRKICLLIDFTVPARSQNENKRKQKHQQILGPCQKTKKLWNIKVTLIPNWKIPQRYGKGTEINGNQRKNWDYSNCNIIQTSQNTEKSPGDLRDLLSLRLQWKIAR